jgi:hypothetical protein
VDTLGGVLVSNNSFASNFARRVGLSPVERNKEDLLAGRRWDLLQAIAWIGSEDKSLVSEVGSWCPPNNILPTQNAARGAALELAELLRGRKGLSFEQALIELLAMLNDGRVLIYVDHTECVPAGLEFQGLRYHADLVGLSPSPDDRYWGYVVVEAESLRSAWHRRATFPAPAQAEEPRKRGRRVVWAWEKMIGDLTRIADQDGLDQIGPNQAAVERWAARWFAERNRGEHPGESAIRRRIAPIFQSRDDHNKEKASK